MVLHCDNTQQCHIISVILTYHTTYNCHPIQYGGSHLKITKASHYQHVMGEKTHAMGSEVNEQLTVLLL